MTSMKSLGEMAFNAAAEYARSRSGIPPVTPASPQVRDSSTRRLLSTQGDLPASVMSGVSNLFFSRSAPAASSGNHDHDQIHGHNQRRDAARKRSGLMQQVLKAATELVGKESTIAMWQLKRRHDWGEVKRVIHEVGDIVQVSFPSLSCPGFSWY